LLCYGRTRDKERKLKQRVFSLDVKKNLFTLKTVQLRSRLLRQVVQSPSLNIFKTQDLISQLTLH